MEELNSPFTSSMEGRAMCSVKHVKFDSSIMGISLYTRRGGIMNEILQMIAQYGFPIVCCVALGFMLYRQMLMHKEEAEKWQKSLDNNTAVMEKVLEKLSVG